MTNLNNTFSVKQLRQNVKFLQCFREWLRLPGCCRWLGAQVHPQVT